VTEGGERLLGASGVAFATVLLAAGMIDDRNTKAYLLGLASFFLVGFVGVLRAELRGAEGETAPLSAAAVIAGSAAVAGYAVFAGLYAAGDFEPAPVAFAISFPQAALLAASGTAMLRTGVVSPRLGLAGQALVPIQLAAALVVLTVGDRDSLIATLGPFAVWTAVAGVLIVRGSPPPVTTTNGSRPR
jgi:hypothetical protein